MSVSEKHFNKIETFLRGNINQFVKIEKKLHVERRDVLLFIFSVLILILNIQLFIMRDFHVALIWVYYFTSNSLLIIFALYFNDNNWLKRNNNIKRWRDYHELVKKLKKDKTELITILIGCKLIIVDIIHEENEKDRIRGKFLKYFNKIKGSP